MYYTQQSAVCNFECDIIFVYREFDIISFKQVGFRHRPVIYRNSSLLKYNFIFPNNKCTKKQLIQQIKNAPHVLIFHSDNKLTNSMQLYIAIIVERICKSIVQVYWKTRTRIHGYGYSDMENTGMENTGMELTTRFFMRLAKALITV